MIPLAAIMSIGEKVLDKVLPDPEAKNKAMAELAKIQMLTTSRPRSSPSGKRPT